MTLAEIKEKLDSIENLSQFAECTGLNYNWLWRFKKGKRKNPSARKIEELEQALLKLEG